MGAIGVPTPRPARVRRVRRESDDTVTLTLEPADGAPPFSFRPGQFTMLYAFGVGDVPISISGDPGERRLLVQTVRAVGAVTSAIAAARRGDVLGVRGPFGTAWPLDEARDRDVLLIAGGLGLAPLRAAVYHLLGAPQAYGRVSLVVGARTPASLLYRSELERWARGGVLQTLVTVDRAALDWTGHVGVVTALLPEAQVRPERTVAFVCGPELMMRFTAQALNRLGVDDRRIYLSMERNMKCAVGHCGHCQFGPSFICKDGPVLRLDRIRSWLRLKEV